MQNRLSKEVMRALTDKFEKTPKQLRPRLSEIRREYSGLTMNAAAQVYARKHGKSIMAKLKEEDRKTLAQVQAIQQVQVSNVSKVDRRTLNINDSPVHNLSFGDKNKINQKVVAIDNDLAVLSEEIDKSIKLSEEEKDDYKSDIQTIASQIGKNKPNRSIINTAWNSVKVLSDVEGFSQIIARVSQLINGFIS